MFVNLFVLFGVLICVKKIGVMNIGVYVLIIMSVGFGNVLIGGLVCESGEFVVSEIFEVIYDGLNFNFILNFGVLYGDCLIVNFVVNVVFVVMMVLIVKGNFSGGIMIFYDIFLVVLCIVIFGSLLYVIVVFYGFIGYCCWFDGYVE